MVEEEPEEEDEEEEEEDGEEGVVEETDAGGAEEGDEGDDDDDGMMDSTEGLNIKMEAPDDSGSTERCYSSLLTLASVLDAEVLLQAVGHKVRNEWVAAFWRMKCRGCTECVNSSVSRFGHKLVWKFPILQLLCSQANCKRNFHENVL